MKYLSLFSGIGGFELGIQQAYVEATTRNKERRSQEDTEGDQKQGFLAEKSQDTQDTTRRDSQHARNFFDQGQPTCVGYSEIDKYAIQIYERHFQHHNFGDITKINADELPDFDFLCGGFPCQAFSIAGLRRGFEDTRGTLFFDIARILKAKQPKILLLENVKGLLSHDSGKTFERIIQTLDELGYDLQWQVLNSKNFGVPQNRERVFIIGHLRGTSRPQVFPIGGSDNMGDEKTQIANTLTSNYWKGAVASRPIPTDGSKIRRLTPKECERLMGFPDEWTAGVSDTQRYKTLGNAVVVNVVEYIISKLLTL